MVIPLLANQDLTSMLVKIEWNYEVENLYARNNFVEGETHIAAEY